VLARDDEYGQKRIVAYVVPAPESRPTVSELRSSLMESLPEHMIPASFVMLDSLPLTPNGKLNRQALPDPEQIRPELSVAYVDPKTQIERDIAAVWREVLKIEKVGLHDNFFELGGDSIRILLVLNKLQRLFGDKISMPQMFEFPTVNALAAHISRADEEQPQLEESFDRAEARRRSLARQTRPR
jgi:acyl carrier protein